MCRVPEKGRLVVPRGQQVSVGAPGHGVELCSVDIESADLRQGVGCPELARAIERGGGQSLAVGTEGEIEHPLSMLRETLHDAAFRIPDGDRSARVGAQESFPSRVENRGPDRERVLPQREFEAPGCRIPDTDAAVVGPGRHAPAIGAESGLGGVSRVSGQSSVRRPRTDLEEENVAAVWDGQKPAVPGF